jgi:hypothetical protein
MSCTSCGGFEFFTQNPNYQTKQEMSVPKTPSCPTKDMMSSCLYTAQGVFICNKENEQSVKGVANNVDMAREAIRDNAKFNNASPWTDSTIQDKNSQILKIYP